jgi:hypothetical protein
MVLDGRIVAGNEMGFHAGFAIMWRRVYLGLTPSQEVCRMSASTERFIVALSVIARLAFITHCLSLIRKAWVLAGLSATASRRKKPKAPWHLDCVQSKLLQHPRRNSRPGFIEGSPGVYP